MTSWGARTPNSTTTSSGQQQLNNNGSGVGFGLPSHSQPSPITPDFTTATTISGSGTEGGESRVSVVLIEDDEEFTTEEEGGFSSSAGTTTFDMNLLSSSTDEAGGGGGIGITDRCRRRDAFLGNLHIYPQQEED